MFPLNRYNRLGDMKAQFNTQFFSRKFNQERVNVVLPEKAQCIARLDQHSRAGLSPLIASKKFFPQSSCWNGTGIFRDGIYPSFTPSFFSMVTSCIRGRPIRALGSSPSMRLISTMPNPSDLALPAQS